MTKTELKSVSAIAAVYGLRMLGLAMVMPIFMLMSTHLKGYTESLAGLAIGAYGLSQALLQIPYGMLSDRFGRKPLIIIGLILFGLGSLLAAFSDSIYGVIAGRFLQGSGAIASVLMALVSDVTSEESRTKAMATIGIGVGVAFSISLVIGPLLGQLWGLEGIFGLTAAFAGVGLLVVIFVVPTPPKLVVHADTEAVAGRIAAVLKNRRLLRLDYGVMTLHMVLVAFFVSVPTILQNNLHIPKAHHSWVYLSVVAPAFFAMIPFIIIGEKRRKMKQVLGGSVALMAVSMALLAVWHQSLAAVWFFIFLYFMAFNLLEASLPSLVSKECRAGSKGTAMGLYSTSQFIGAFLGGAIAGIVLQHFGVVPVLVLMVALLLIWLVIIIGMPQPSYSTSFVLKLASLDSINIGEVSQSLAAVRGVEDVMIVPAEQAAYLKVDKKALDEETLKQLPFVAG
ncbi:MFS transporter [Mangrovitalea sediminis]|uniref:MFS transporter n=1 Tax=Mangrovitalea sediminis TaxID=1982043 RepID=UPI000BE55D7B|nr:MFS transporter [Mangrovitalea sediminis]